jgi:hypothetical protein
MSLQNNQSKGGRLSPELTKPNDTDHRRIDYNRHITCTDPHAYGIAQGKLIKGVFGLSPLQTHHVDIPYLHQPTIRPSAAQSSLQSRVARKARIVH